jgi:hypothetical protein
VQSEKQYLTAHSGALPALVSWLQARVPVVEADTAPLIFPVMPGRIAFFPHENGIAAWVWLFN